MKRTLLLIVLLVVLVFVPFAVFEHLQSAVSTDPGKQTFIVNSGDSLSLISQRLHQNGLIRHPQVFIATAYLQRLNQKLRAGSFQLSSSFSTPEIVKLLATGGSTDVWLQIKEGYRLEQVAAALPQAVNFSPQEFIDALKGQEGRLFPDTYRISPQSTPEEIGQTLQSYFSQKWQEASQDKTSQLSANDSLILASLLEREARTLASRQLVAGILLNRLELGMPLQVDATVQYARDSRPSVSQYWTPVSKAELKIDSPYNTYLYPGLPPGPICNPGYDSLFAACHPTDSDYLYYITGNDNKMHYARTLEEHNLNISRYLR